MKQANRIDVSRLSLWRAWREMSQADLEKAAGISRTAISNLENGTARANPATVYKLARGLGISRKQLLEEDPPEAWLDKRDGRAVA